MKRPPDFYTDPPPQGPVGSAPVDYIGGELPGAPNSYATSEKQIPGGGKRALDRHEVVKVSRDSKVDPLVAYACIMAWGRRNFHNYRLSLSNGNAGKVARLVDDLRKSADTREQDFAATQNAAAQIPGLGISFYTKLLFFLRPKQDAYILDQWTAKSATVLFPKAGIKVTSGGMPDPNTTPKTYEAFCKALEDCAGTGGWGPNWKNGEEVERTIFDRPRGPWRSWVKERFKPADKAKQTKPKVRGKGGRPPVPPAKPPAFPPPPNTPPAGDDASKRAFANHLHDVFIENVDAGVDLPLECGGFNEPNRLHCIAYGCVTWQFIINQHEVRAQIFFQGKCVGSYDNKIVPEFKPQTQGKRHDFGGGIYGNGPADGKTRAINRPADRIGGYGSPVDEWPDICKSAIDAMHQLFEVFG